MIKGSSSEFSLQGTDGRRQEVLATERNNEILLRKSKRCCKIVGIGASNGPRVVDVLSNLYFIKIRKWGEKITSILTIASKPSFARGKFALFAHDIWRKWNPRLRLL